MRADARRSVDLLVAAAKKIFAERGADAPLDEIARAAGVGNATMYRHFPTRRDLIIAVHAEEVAALCARGDAALTAESPGDALFDWLLVFIGYVADKRDLALALTEDPSERHTELFAQWHAAMTATATALLDRAQVNGAVHPDIDGRDLLVLAGGIAVGAGSDRAERLLHIVRHGASTGRTA
jgi:AcrR family transcriptional regulator